MDVAQFILVFLGYFVTGITCGTVDFFSICRDSSSLFQAKRVVFDFEKLTVLMNDNTWTALSNTCTVIFKAYGDYDDLYFQFQSFGVTNVGIKVEVRSKSSSDFSSYSLEETYRFSQKPTIDDSYVTNNYMKITVTRDILNARGLSAELDIFTSDYKRDNEDDLPSTVGSIKTIVIGSVTGSIGFIGIVVVVILCAVCISRNRTNQGVVMATGNPQVPRVVAQPVVNPVQRGADLLNTISSVVDMDIVQGYTIYINQGESHQELVKAGFHQLTMDATSLVPLSGNLDIPRHIYVTYGSISEFS